MEACFSDQRDMLARSDMLAKADAANVERSSLESCLLTRAYAPVAATHGMNGMKGNISRPAVSYCSETRTAC